MVKEQERLDQLEEERQHLALTPNGGDEYKRCHAQALSLCNVDTLFCALFFLSFFLRFFTRLSASVCIVCLEETLYSLDGTL